LGAVVSRSVRPVTGALGADIVPTALTARTVNVYAESVCSQWTV
jgi:hypothetical protein